ncbi:MAG: hypothetical protein PUF49_11320 [Firmicutes bacterium]|nr:hypothetical protein [Bacillota bacterium]
MLMKINNFIETVYDHKSFEDLVDKYMGSEAADYYKKEYERQTTAIERIRNDLKDFLDEYEQEER